MRVEGPGAPLHASPQPRDAEPELQLLRSKDGQDTGGRGEKLKIYEHWQTGDITRYQCTQVLGDQVPVRIT